MLAIISPCRCALLRKAISVNIKQLNLSFSNLRLCSSTSVEPGCGTEPSSSKISNTESFGRKRRPYLSAFAYFLKEYESKEHDNPGTPVYLWQNMTADEKSVYEAKAKAFNDQNKLLATVNRQPYGSGHRGALSRRRDRKRDYGLNGFEKFRKMLVEHYDMPKQPLNVVWRFAIASGNSNCPRSELNTMYNNLPEEEKMKYSNAFSADLAVHRENLKEWKAKMIDNGNENLVRRLGGRRQSYSKSPKSDWEELATQYGRPKHPGSVMSLFRSDLYAKHSMILDRKAFRRKWLELEPEKRAEYSERLRQKTDEYRAALRQWREKMLASGNEEIVRILSRCKTGARPNFWLPETRRSLACLMLAKKYSMPKYPVGPFKKFMETLGAKMSITDKSVLYRELPEEKRKQFYDAFREELEAYRKNLKEWKGKMIVEGHEDVLKMLKPKRVIEIYRKARKMELAAEHGRPKRPKNPFLRYLIEYTKKRPASEPFEFAKIAQTWNALSDEEKMKYKAAYQADFAVYSKEYAKWKAGMLVAASDETLEELDIRPFKKRDSSKKKRTVAVEVYGMPTFPLYPFHRYLRDIGASLEPAQREELLKKWQSLEPSERNKYLDEFRSKRTVYYEKLREWKEKMIAEGKENIVKRLRQTGKKKKRITPEKGTIAGSEHDS